MNDILQQLLQLGPGIGAGLTGNGPGMQAFMEGFQRTQQMLQQQKRQKEQDALALQDRDLALADRQRLMDRQATADAEAQTDRERRRALEGLQIPGHLAEIGSAAESPDQAQAIIESALPNLMKVFGQETMAYGMPAIEQATRTITGRQKKQVEAYVEQALKTSYVADNPEADPELQLPEHLSRLMGKPSAKLSELQQFAQLPVGKPAKPKGAPFNLSPGQTRFDADGNPIASMPDRPKPAGDGTPEQIFVVRNGVVIPITKGTAQPGDVPYSPRTQNDSRPVTSGDAADIAEFNTALDDVATVRETLKGNRATGTSAAVGAAVPNAITELTGWGADAKQKNAVIARVKQVIGKALEGGVLRKEDESKYAKILPTISDIPEVVATKLDGLERAIRQRQQNKLDALADAGYDISRFASRKPSASPAAPAPATPAPTSGPKVGERRSFNGTLAEWDGKGWKKVAP
jgi:hypothetical protein